MPSVPLLSKGSKSDRQTTASNATPDRDAGSNPPPLVARLLYGSVLVYTGINHFQNAESMIGYAESKGVPEADLAVPVTGAMLVGSGVGIVLWRLPRLAAATAVAFFIGVTPTMHDFWNFEGDERQSQRNNFLKNMAMLGAAITFLSWNDSE